MTKEANKHDDKADAMGAIDAAIHAARLSDPVVDHEDGRRHVFVPDGFKLVDVTSPDQMSPLISQSVVVDDRASLSAYANRFSNGRSILFGDYDAGEIVARLDWHSGKDAGLAAQKNAHKAVLRLRDSEEWARWNEMEGDMHSQEDFAHFIEENVADVVDPEHGVLLEICRDLEASQGVAFRSGVRLDNGDRTFRYETETRVKSELTVPTELRLSIPLYFGEEPMEIRAKFRFRPTPAGLMLGIRWHRVEYARQAVFRQMAFQTADDTGLPLFYGRV